MASGSNYDYMLYLENQWFGHAIYVVNMSHMGVYLIHLPTVLVSCVRVFLQ
jgi:hypothetical protein